MTDVLLTLVSFVVLAFITWANRRAVGGAIMPGAQVSLPPKREPTYRDAAPRSPEKAPEPPKPKARPFAVGDLVRDREKAKTGLVMRITRLGGALASVTFEDDDVIRHEERLLRYLVRAK